MIDINWVSLQNLIGGFAIGAEKAFGTPPGLIVHCGWPNDVHYIEYMNTTRKLNIPVVQMNDDYETFATEKDEQIYNEYVSKHEIHAAVMTPLCSGLSMLNCQNDKNSSKGRGNADSDQNQNMYNLTKLGMRMNAKVVVFENAPTAYTKAGKDVVDRLYDIAIERKYSTQLFKTNTLVHGIPQSRSRTFIIFYKDSNPGLFEYEEIQYPILADYLSEVNSTMKHYSDNCKAKTKDVFYECVLDYAQEDTFFKSMKKIGYGKRTWSSLQLIDHVIGFDKAIEFCHNMLEENEDEDSIKKYTNGIRILEHCKNKVSLGKGYWDSSTYMANDGLFINAVISKNIHRSLHPTEERGFNIRELLHLMGMPHDFTMKNPIKDWQQISQNVPVKTSTFIASQIKKFLENKLPITSTPFVKQDNIKKQLDTPSFPAPAEW